MILINETMYSVYGNAGFSWPLVSCAVIINAISIPGIFLNFAVIWITIKSRKLHGTANCLLALYSFYEILHELGLLLFLYLAVSGRNFIPYHLAIQICTPSAFGLAGLSITMAFTGLDRLFCVLFPKFPNWVNVKFYLLIIIGICTSFCALEVYNLYGNNLPPATMITGFMADVMLAGSAGAIYSTVTFALYNATITIYVVVGIVIRYKIVPNPNSTEDTGRRIFRSLLIIIIFNVGGYYLMRLFRLLIVPNIASPVTVWFGTFFMGIPLIISSASNGPILYFTSHEYRNAFRREFAILFGNKVSHIIKPTTTLIVAPMPTLQRRQFGNSTQLPVERVN